MLPGSKAYLMAASLLPVISSCTGSASDDDTTPRWIATRSGNNPLLTVQTDGMVEEHGFMNVNGPSVIRAPSWIEQPLGRYYMYFAHHRGSFIRLAYADSLEGPWTVWPDSTLRLTDSPALDHVASPDVHVDERSKIVRMYFHSVDDTSTWKQTTYLATSTDGLHFEASPNPIGPPYMRLFRMGRTWWGIAKVRGGPGGVLLRAVSPEGPFHYGPRLIPEMRHAAVLVDGDLAYVFFTRIGDAPERVFVTSFDPDRRWLEATQTNPREVLRPELDFEGANLPVDPSSEGEAAGPVNAVRDPFVYSEAGKHYLFYSIAGERGIAVARLTKGKKRSAK